MKKLIKKKYETPLSTRYSFPITEELKEQLEKLRDDARVDVNEEFRRYTKEMIAAAQEEGLLA